jgi:hypothetical protein
MDVEMQKANHNGSTGDQINAVYSINNANFCSYNNCCGDSRHKQVTTDLVMSSGTTKFLHTQYVSEKSDYKSWKVVKDFGRVVFKTFILKSSGFLKRFVCGVYDRQHMSVKQLVAASRRTISTASCGTPELKLQAVGIDLVLSHKQQAERERITLNHWFNYTNWITNLTKLKTLIKCDYTKHTQSSIFSN